HGARVAEAAAERGLDALGVALATLARRFPIIRRAQAHRGRIAGVLVGEAPEIFEIRQERPEAPGRREIRRLLLGSALSVRHREIRAVIFAGAVVPERSVIFGHLPTAIARISAASFSILARVRGSM